jgi:ubiquinone/menaquinone biosynthesis C-methylase UbiE
MFPATAMPDRDWWHALWPDPDRVIKALRIEPGMKVLDLGCGDGYFTAAIARQVGAGRVIGLDLDPVMLEQAQAACKGMTNCSWLLGDAMALSRLLDSSVDYVLIANTFHGVPDKTALAREIAKVLKPNGRFAIVNWHPLPREQTTVLGQPRGPKTAMRMSAEQTRIRW